jgi:hypothetical protein
MVPTWDVDTIQLHQNSTPSKVKLIIRNQFPGIELVYPVYASDGTTCCLSPNQRVDVGSTMQASFSIGPDQEPIGALMCKLQGKNIDEFSDEAISSEEVTHIWLVMIWKVYKSGKFCIVSDLIEHDKSHVWDNNELMKLNEYYELFDVQYGPVEETWLMHDNAVVTTNLNIIREEEYYELEMTISEGSIRDDTQRLHYIGLDM